MRHILSLIFLLVSVNLFASGNIKINDDLELVKISDDAYIHVSWFDLPKYGHFPSNGLIYISGGRAILLDTPMSDSLSKVLVDYIRDTMHLQIVNFIPNHWHDDCTEGLKYINELNIQSLSNKLTHDILIEKGLPTTSGYFTGSDTLNLDGKPVICYYPGGAHTIDNIVVWFPDDKILFGGCMVRSMETNTLGNTADAVLEEWGNTIEKVIEAFPDAQIVIPGHGDTGGIELLLHTLDLLKNK